MKYISAEETSNLLNSHINTIYRMCRDGSLPAVKHGREWRIDHDFLAKKLNRETLTLRPEVSDDLVVGALAPGHTLGVFSSKELIDKFEYKYFAAALEQGYRIYKGCWNCDLDEQKQKLSNAGLNVEKLESDGAFVFDRLDEAFGQSREMGVAAAWLKATTGALKMGYKGLAGIGSPSIDCCGDYWGLLALENSLSQMLNDQPVSAVCVYLMDNSTDNIIHRLADLIKRHDRFFIQTEDKSVLLFGQTQLSVEHSSKI